MKFLLQKFWDWYEKHYTLNVGVAAFLFLLQLIHLYWLSADVVSQRLTGHSYFELTGILEILVLFVDYTEIPAILTTSLVYINGLRKQFNGKDVAFLFFVNSQWLHIFWITDEFVVAQFTGRPEETLLPVWLAWIAILIDYLELPVIYDTIKRFFVSLKQKV